MAKLPNKTKKRFLRNNSGGTLFENLVAISLFSLLCFQFLFVCTRMIEGQLFYKNITVAQQLVDRVSEEASVSSVDYAWFDTAAVHYRYFDMNGKETIAANSKYTMKWTVQDDNPIVGMKMAAFQLTWNESANIRNLAFRVAR